MRITLNGTGLELDTPGATLGSALSAVDDLADKAGEIVIGVRLDGVELDADGVGAESARDLASVRELEVTSAPASELRGKAYASAIAALDLAIAMGREAGRNTEREAPNEAWTAWRDAFEGLLSADEASFADYVGRELGALGAAPAFAEFAALAERLSPIRSVFAERLDEVVRPERAMADAAAIFGSRKKELTEVPVLLQTGKDAQAMRSLVFVVELVNKATRIIPELARRGFDADGFMIGEAALPAFYAELNQSLRELMNAFEAKDAVAIGDVAMYELEPRLDALFTAFEERFREAPRPGDGS